MSSKHIIACQICTRIIVLRLIQEKPGPMAWRLFDCPHCEKTNAVLLPSGIAAAHEVKDTTLVLHPQCAGCGKEARIQFADWDDHQGAIGAPDWECPHCNCRNTIPSVGRIISVEASPKDVIVA